MDADKKKLSDKKYREKNRAKMIAYLKAWRQRNRDYMSAYREKNADKIAAQGREWIAKNRPKVNAGKRRWYRKHRAKILAYHKGHYEKNKEKLLAEMSAYQKRNRAKRTKYESEYRKRRSVSDHNYRLRNALRCRIVVALVRKGIDKNLPTAELIGCSIEQARKHLESQFREGMSWENFGQWHIDHISPLASFDLRDEAQLRAATHYTNLQPLWAKENMAKGKRTIKNASWKKHQDLAPRALHAA